jgi:hypothetical protein
MKLIAALRTTACLAALTLAGSAHADFLGNLGTISAPASVAFSNATGGNLSVSQLTLPSPYNFIDRWDFMLSGSASVTSLAAAFKFDDGIGPLDTFGIDSLQVNLLNSNGVVVSGWQNVTANGPFSQTISITPATGLTDGLYSLQIRGNLVAPPAAYSGTLIAAAPSAVPLPATLPLLAAGAGMIGWMARRRRSA